MIMGNNEVTPIGTTSLIHQLSIQMTIPSAAEAAKERPKGCISRLPNNTSGPKSKMNNFFFSISSNVLVSPLAAVVTFAGL